MGKYGEEQSPNCAANENKLSGVPAVGSAVGSVSIT